MIKPYLQIKKIKGKGRGVFATEIIPSGTRIETSPVLVLSKKDTDKVDKTFLHNYIFLWGEKETRSCIALGYCSVYNHDYNPNCEYEMDFEKETMSIITRREVKKGEELCINYHGDVEDQSPVWFDVKKSKTKAKK
ncbi:SET domain-containing protein-lysine N-methyltransferase [Chitinophaga caeni]|uniref:SET domain-containing protein-lysine N-methyltransferase n=1 Tax=Chitinophaga caeni TaxID=2029983 RepID=A0A291R1G7_9BACT|nr:SET domain-containing protein [Chitinophaga caeni]ATL49982.1 SET domain-containing protein-lysine N-methyltransferase [Chitinophaga caeni]